MITYLCIAVFSCLVYRSFRKSFEEGKEPIYILLGIPLLMGTLLGGTTSLLPQVLIRGTHYKHTTISESTYSIPIVSVKNRSNLEGSFTLGTGSIGETEYYVYFKQYEDGGIQKDKKPTYCTTLYEKDEQPRLEWTEVTKKAPWYVSFGFDSLDIKTIREGNYRLIVPKGTVLLRFEID